MFGLIKKLLMARQIQFNEGNIQIFTQNVLFIPAKSMVHVVKKLENDDEATLYNSAKLVGYEWFKKMDKKYTIDNRDILQWGLDTLTFAGWGVMRLVNLNVKGKYSRTIMENSIVGKLYRQMFGKSKYPVDNVLRGFMASGSCVVHKDPTMEMIETKCIGKGDKVCEIVAMPRKKINLKDPAMRMQIGKNPVNGKIEL